MLDLKWTWDAGCCDGWDIGGPMKALKSPVTCWSRCDLIASRIAGSWINTRTGHFFSQLTKRKLLLRNVQLKAENLQLQTKSSISWFSRPPLNTIQPQIKASIFSTIIIYTRRSRRRYMSRPIHVKLLIYHGHYRSLIKKDKQQIKLGKVYGKERQ